LLEAALIEKCADPSLDLNVVQEFVHAVGNGDPLAVTVKVGGKMILVEKAATPEEALAITRRYVGRAIVRVGVTSYPAHLGDRSGMDLSPVIFDACDNLRLGTTMFAKVMRVVAAWYGRNASSEALPYVLADSIYAWVSGEFEGKDVFQAEDPGGLAGPQAVLLHGKTNIDDPPMPSGDEDQPRDITSADMRIDLSGIGSPTPSVPVR